MNEGQLRLEAGGMPGTEVNKCWVSQKHQVPAVDVAVQRTCKRAWPVVHKVEASARTF